VSEKKKPGPKPDVVKMPLPFEEAVKAVDPVAFSTSWRRWPLRQKVKRSIVLFNAPRKTSATPTSSLTAPRM